MNCHLITILRDHLNHAATAPFDADWEELFDLSKKHEVTAIVYTQCKDFIPRGFAERFSGMHSTALFYYANRLSMMTKIDSALADIEHFTIKGASVARFYPVPAYRTMGDTDIVVHTADREEADKRLKSLGLECVSSHEDREWQYYYKNMEFELHDHLVYREAVNVEAQERYFNDFWKHLKGNELDWNFHFLFLILHLRKHFMNKGIGFRQFMDIAVLCKNGPAFDWAWIEGELKALNLWSFTERVFALNAHWFGTQPPLAIDALPEDFFASATDLILKNGIFGFHNEENRDSKVVNAVRGRGNSKAAMLINTFKSFFPGYRVMRTVPHYSYLRGRPYLLPAVWAHRAFRAIARKRVKTGVQTIIDNSITDQDTIDRREAVYRQWGL